MISEVPYSLKKPEKFEEVPWTNLKTVFRS